jgi:hypothetical protein
VEKNNHTSAQRWWRTLPNHLAVEQARTSLELILGNDVAPAPSSSFPG